MPNQIANCPIRVTIIAYQTPLNPLLIVNDGGGVQRRCVERIPFLIVSKHRRSRLALAIQENPNSYVFSVYRERMAHHVDNRFNWMVALCAAACFSCGQSNTAGSPSPMSSAGSAGSSSGATGAAGGAPSAAGASGADVSNGGSPALGGATGGTSSGGTETNGGAAGAMSAGAAGTSGGAAGTSGGAGGAPASGTPFVYVGDTGTGINIYNVDTTLGQLTFVKTVAGGNSPTFLAVDPTSTHLYAVNEGDANVASFSIDQKTADLTFINRLPSGGDGPAFISVDHSGKYAMVANYDGGNASVFPINENGGLGTATDNKTTGKYTHNFVSDPTNKFAFVVSLATDTVSQFSFDTTSGKLTPNSTPTVKLPAGTGPRHLAFHPNGKFAYLIAETKYSLTAYSYDAALGQLTSLNNSLSLLPAGADGTGNTGAEVVVAPSGNFVYGSNRGNDSIATFSIDSATGKITFVGTIPSGGKVPWDITLSADGKLMLVANESGNVTSFSVNVTTGALTKLKSITIPKPPHFVGFVYLPGH
jgi:6-phosphogluconolactonase